MRTIYFFLYILRKQKTVASLLLDLNSWVFFPVHLIFYFKFKKSLLQHVKRIKPFEWTPFLNLRIIKFDKTDLSYFLIRESENL